MAKSLSAPSRCRFWDRVRVSCFLWAVVLTAFVSSFVPIGIRFRRRCNSTPNFDRVSSIPNIPSHKRKYHCRALRMMGNGDKTSPLFRYESGENGWQLYNSFEQFLNQCAIQSLLFLLTSLKDRHTALWLEDFTQPVIHTRTRNFNDGNDQILSNMATALNDALHETQMERPIKLLSYHGLGAINTTIFPSWDSYFHQLLQAGPVTYSIESSRPHVPTYTLDIVPASLCSRIISVREQIAREFVKDLDVIAENSLSVMEKYRRKGLLSTSSSSNTTTKTLERIHTYFLEMSVHEDYVPSPLRKGNFDLLLTLTSQEAIHRILNRLCEKDMEGSYRLPEEYLVVGGSPVHASSSTIQFLRNFYMQRIGTHFTGSNYYGRADDFMDELLQQTLPPSVMQLQDTQYGGLLVDPEQLVEMIFTEREKVASDWIELSLDVPTAHTTIKRWQLNKLMGSDDNPTIGERRSFE